MPKKKVVKKKGKKKAKKTKEYLPCVYDIPKYEDPREVTPRVKVTTLLYEPASPLMRVEDTYYIDTKVDTIVKQIKALHQGSVGNVLITKHKGNFLDVLDNDKTLLQNGVSPGEDHVFYYDFKPVCHPLLE